MREIERICDQLRRSFDGEAWHGDSVREILAGVTAERAAARPLSGRHSIWELVMHVAAWERVTLRRVRGEAYRLPEAENFPAPSEVNETAWKAALESLYVGHTELVAAVGAMRDEQLQDRVPGEEYNYYFLLHGVIQHNLYHAGQIAVLK